MKQNACSGNHKGSVTQKADQREGNADEIYVRAYVALGSNLGDSAAHLSAAIAALEAFVSICNVRESPRYLTDPMGPQDQPDYLNSVCEFDTSLTALALLDVLQSIEAGRGRARPQSEQEIAALRWHARTLDLDLLLFGEHIIQHERLNVPHVGMTTRAFVLKPLFDLAPELRVPGASLVSDLLASVDTDGVRRQE